MLLMTGHEPEAGDQHHNGRLWRAMQSLKCQPQGESIYALLGAEIRRRIAVQDLWIEV